MQIVGASLIAAATSRIGAATAADDETREVDFLLVQNAQGVSLKHDTLRLKGVAPDTL